MKAFDFLNVKHVYVQLLYCFCAIMEIIIYNCINRKTIYHTLEFRRCRAGEVDRTLNSTGGIDFIFTFGHVISWEFFVTLRVKMININNKIFWS